MGQPGVDVNLSATPSTSTKSAPAPQTTSPVESASPKPAESPTQVPTATPTSAPKTEATSATATPKKVKMANPNALPIAGEKVDEILSHTHFELGATGVRLSEEHDEIFPEHHELDKVTLAPTGSDLTDKKEEIPAVVPDTSHLSIKPN